MKFTLKGNAFSSALLAAPAQKTVCRLHQTVLAFTATEAT
jgi:hypothetical protein